MPPRLRTALWIAFLQHGVLILAARYRLSYDAYFHMFLGDHYLRNWWNIWEPRWYTGFEVTSYPPLVHQLIALLGRLTGLDAAFAVLLWATLTAYPLAVYAFSRIFTGGKAATYAALGAAFLPSLYLSAHTFGQLPSLASTLLVLFGGAVLADFLKKGDRFSGALGVALFACATAAHHATLLFQPWVAGAVLLRVFQQRHGAFHSEGNASWRGAQRRSHLVFGAMFRGGLLRQRTARSDGVIGVAKTAGEERRRVLLRFIIFILATSAAGLAVIWPFWVWGLQQTIQTTIDHISRHNFFMDGKATLLFFLPMYGLLIPFIPVGLWMGALRRYRGLGIALLMLFLLGLGDTTPLPRLLFGAGWAWLTYDRFSLWASLLLLPFFGLAVALFIRRRAPRVVWMVYLGLMGVMGLVIGNAPAWLPTQPAPIDMRPIVAFLGQGEHAQFRYLTFGFGDQMAYLSRLTEATTIDGSYHTARQLPELRASGIAQIDTAYWFPDGLTALKPVLAQAGEHGVRWGFVNLNAYKPLLASLGWAPLTTLSNGVEVWENPAASPPPPVTPPATSPFEEFSWGVLPLFALLSASLLAIRRYGAVRHQPILAGGQAFAIGLLPMGLTFWYYRKIFIIEHDFIYFTYSDVLVFLSDGLAILIVLLGWIQRQPERQDNGVDRSGWSLGAIVKRPESWLAAFCALATLSVIWSLDWRTSVYFSLHLWLCLSLYLALRKIPHAWRWFALGCCAALSIQVIVGLWQFIAQSTALTAPLGLTWPGTLDAGLRGASVVQTGEGMRWLRAYGTLPHPNLMGGFTLAMLAAPLALFLSSPGKRSLLLILFIVAGAVLLGVTFSRSAWVGLALTGVWLMLHWRRTGYKRLGSLALAGLVVLIVMLISLHPLFQTRLGYAQAPTEQVSNFTRQWLVLRAVEMFRERPILGSGAGSFSLALTQHVPGFNRIEPVHNVALLIAGELGTPGMVLLVGLLATLALKMRRRHSTQALVLSAALIGMGAIGFFDHYLWTLAPGRILLVTLMGLWAGQGRSDENRS